MRYQLDTSRFAGSNYGLFTFRLLGNKLEDLTFINLPGAAPDEDLGQGPIDGESEAPEWQAVFDLGRERGLFFVSYQFSQGSTRRRAPAGDACRRAGHRGPALPGVLGARSP